MAVGMGLGALSLQLTSSLPAQAAISKVFVAGASGATGRRVVQELRKKGLSVRAGVRVRVHAVHQGLETLCCVAIPSPATIAGTLRGIYCMPGCGESALKWTGSG